MILTSGDTYRLSLWTAEQQGIATVNNRDTMVTVGGGVGQSATW